MMAKPRLMSLFSSDPDGGGQAVKFDSSSSLAVAQHLFAAPSGSVVWADWHVKVKRGNPPDGATNSAAGLGFNADGRLNVWDGDSNNWVTLTNHTPVADGSEVRLTVRLDYAQQKWLVCLDGLLRAQNLGFGSNPGSFSSFSAQGREGAIDGIRITVTEPDDISADGDNLPDSWEIEYFGDLDETDSGNPDSDGLTNLQEYQRGTDPTLADTDADGLTDGAEVNTYGTNPLLADTDSDGMNDGNEVFYGENPTNPVNSVAYAALPFIENFETNTVNLGSLHGQNDWTVSPTNGAQVQTNALYEGEGAQAVVFDTEASGGATAIHLVASSNSLVWADWYVQVKQGPPAAGGTNSVAALGFNTDGRLTVWNGTSGEWVVLTNHTPLAEGTWVRLSVQMDYTKQKWLVCLNSTNVAENIGFGSTVGAFSSFAAKGPEGRMDALAVTATQPDGLHVDEDNLPDSWEMQYFGNLDQVDSGDPDGDSLTNLEEYELGTNPANADSDGDGMMDGDEVAAYANPLLADSDGDGVVDGSDSTPIFADHPVGEGPALTILDPENESLILW